MSEKTVKWHLPGFCYNFYLNQIIIHLMKEYPRSFRDGYKVGSVYGTFPGAIWNGGRAVFGISSKKDIKRILDTYEKFNVPVRFTWTNPFIEEKHVYDTYCNMIMEMADNGKNEVLVNSKVLESYLRQTYPNFGFISSTTKRITDLVSLLSEMTSDYKLVVLDYDLNKDSDVLDALSPVAGRVEILVDEICYPGCEKRKKHYEDEAMAQLTFDKGSAFNCPNRTTPPSFKECMKRPSFISNEEIGSYIDKGFVNFKLVGRGLPQDMVIDSYIYYLVKDEEQDFIRKQIAKEMGAIMGRKR